MLESKRPFLEALRQAFHHFDFPGKFLHVVIQQRSTHRTSGPIHVALSIIINEHTRVYAHHSLDGFSFTSERPFWLVGRGDTYAEAASVLRS